MEEPGERVASAPFGALLRRHRQAAGLTQEALAERAGLAASAIAALERGRRLRPHPHTVRQLAAALRLDPAQHARFEATGQRAGSRPRSDQGRERDAARTLPASVRHLTGAPAAFPPPVRPAPPALSAGALRRRSPPALSAGALRRRSPPALSAGALRRRSPPALSAGDVPRALALLRESLAARQDLGDDEGVAECLEGLAALSADVRGAAPLLGAAAALRERLHTPLPAPDRAQYEAAVARARAALGAAAWTAADAAGRRLPFAEAVALALAEPVTSSTGP